MINIDKDLHIFLTQRRPHGISKDTHDLVPSCRIEDLKNLAKGCLKNMLGKKEVVHSGCFPGSECDECLNHSAIDFIMEFFNISNEEIDELRPKYKLESLSILPEENIKCKHRNNQIWNIGLPCCEEFDKSVLKGRISKCVCYKNFENKNKI